MELFSKLKKKKKQKETKLIVTGLDSSGKTTILNNFLKKPKLENPPSPTMGIQIETTEYKKHTWRIYELSGSERFRKQWNVYYEKTNGIIFIIDCNDKTRFDTAMGELQNLLTADELENVPVLIFANKMDISTAIKVTEVTERVKNLKYLEDRKWHVQQCCGYSGVGLPDGFDWLSNTLYK